VPKKSSSAYPKQLDRWEEMVMTDEIASGVAHGIHAISVLWSKMLGSLSRIFRRMTKITSG